MAALRRPDFAAHRRQLAARRLDQGLAALPRGARRNSSTGLIAKGLIARGAATEIRTAPKNRSFVCMQTVLAFEAPVSPTGGHHVGSTTGRYRSRRNGVRDLCF